jgi:hypothetical protein
MNYQTMAADEEFVRVFFPRERCHHAGRSGMCEDEGVEAGLAFVEALAANDYHPFLASRYLHEELGMPVMITADEFLWWAWLHRDPCFAGLLAVPGRWADVFFRAIAETMNRTLVSSRHPKRLLDKMKTTLTCLLRWFAPSPLDVKLGIGHLHEAADELSKENRRNLLLHFCSMLYSFHYVGNDSGNGRSFLNGTERHLSALYILGLDPTRILPLLAR